MNAFGYKNKWLIVLLGGLANVCASDCEKLVDFDTDFTGSKAEEQLKRLLSGRKVAYVRSPAYRSFALQIAGAPLFRPVVSFEEGIKAVIKGDAEVAIVDAVAADLILTKYANEDVKVLSVTFQGGVLGTGVAMMFRKGDPLKQVFDKGVEALRKEGRLSELSLKWFHIDVNK